MNKNYNKMASELAKAGRHGDDQILHVSSAELKGLGSLLPSGKLPINPETGQPEAFVFSLATLLTSMLLGAGTGAISGGISAESKGIPLWKGILVGAGTGAATGAVTAGIGGVLAPAADAGTKLAAGAADVVAGGTELANAAGGGGAAIDSFISGGGEVLGTVVPEVPLALANEVLPAAEFAAGTAPNISAYIPPAPPPVEIPYLATTPEVGTSSVLALPEGAGGLASTTASPVSGSPTTLGESVSQSWAGITDSLGPNNVDYLKSYLTSPTSIMAPIMATEAVLPYELDEDEDKPYSGSRYTSWETGPGPTWESGPGVSWEAKDGGEVKRRENRHPHRAGVRLPFNQGGLASLRRI